MTEPTITTIPLNKLKLSPLNIRRKPATEEEDNELLASIRAHGIKQNLIAYKSGSSYLVHAGGRRLTMLQRLAEAGDVAKDAPIACMIESKKDAEETSFVENLLRADMHPADLINGMVQLRKNGRTPVEIANRFGLTVNKVDRYLALADVSPVILDAFRDDKLSLECVQAFSITDDQSRQEAIWNKFVESRQRPAAWSIKQQLTDKTYNGNSKIARFVGLDVYKEAGGNLLRDLFSGTDETCHLTDGELLEQLAHDKLKQAAEAELAKGWKWADVETDVSYDAFRHYGRVYPEPVDLDPALAEELEQAQARLEELSETYDEDSWNEDNQAEEDRLTDRVDEIQRLIDNSAQFTAEQRAIAGVCVTIAHDGSVRLEAGLVRPEDLPKPKRGPAKEASSDDDSDRDDAPTIQMPYNPRSHSPSIDDPVAQARKAQGVSQSLAEELRATRHQILKAHLAADFDTAFHVMLYSMAKEALGPRDYRPTPIDVSIRPAEVFRSRDVIKDTVAARMLDTIRETLSLDWLKLPSPADYEAMCALTNEEKHALFASCVAHGVIQQLSTDKGANPVIEQIGKTMQVDTAACWRPTAANYWNRVKKDHAITVARELIDDRWADDKAKDKKPVIAAAMETAFSEDPSAAGLTSETATKTSTWMPDGMAFTGDYTERPASSYSWMDDDDDDDDVDVADGQGDPDVDHQPDAAGDGDLPAFLTDTAA